ncbi:FAD-dependent oxidoreductase [Marinilabilia salmonicolor]|jgi:NADPH-dependent 2,4-dienoyl-CoA reductase/sulfur reductase-like enzyme/rhodanese-related sulfurtransferase|uniref:NADPH-dependent 2,4-dienoyl-CoA reductase/sulfur reductase-like enzyme n=1 Tax=Marinilabilia salmonicolor TaxID=989 RepID=A0A2T0XII8_9BACT|nr:FAD-dependent oxidoreductase [Marinilabilia salmonicolor]PRY98769.1 NADPH-dependent 2,4-dienoyl-CoA reductase/sulfur reductase-like enzyme [Marinilabilia salmonicolor]RCW38970.1 NADPH-dependent 2,4-dienoyl-CoA reductase/sulfur reductase-like enzyme [Marinilabilia salmonicolor]
MSKKKIIVIGGSAAGPKAAAKARRMDEFAEITMFQKAPDLSMASCGYPYFVGGFFDDRNKLLCTPTGVVRDPKFYWSAKGIVAKVNTEVTRIDRDNKLVEYTNLETGEKGTQEYDKLVITTGATPNMPPIPGVGLEGITTLQSMQDADYLRRVRDDGKIKKAVVIGGGLIGIETLEALHLAGIELTLVELLPQLLVFLDWKMAKLVENYLKTKANVITKNGVSEFVGENGKLTAVKLQNGTEIPCELAVVAIGVRPNVKLAKEAGLNIGELGGISTNEFMQTNDPDIYAAGDCCEVKNLITGKNVLAPYGDLANLQGRAVGENITKGNIAKFPGTIQTGICKLFDHGVGITGLSEAKAIEAGFDYERVLNASPDKPGFMNGQLLITKLVVERKSRKILGAQVLGPGDVSKQLAIWATAIKGNLTVDDMVNADLPYAPPFSLAIDHSIATAHIMQNKLEGIFDGISSVDLKAKVDKGEDLFILDARGADEYEQMRLGIGETLIPIGKLRERLHELPQDKNKEIVTLCKISLRGYEAAVLLKHHGYKNVKILEGGIAAWPFEREK